MFFLLLNHPKIKAIARWGAGAIAIAFFASLTLFMAWEHTNNHLLKPYREQVYGDRQPTTRPSSMAGHRRPK
jgi:hypothetical protein